MQAVDHLIEKDVPRKKTRTCPTCGKVPVDSLIKKFKRVFCKCGTDLGSIVKASFSVGLNSDIKKFWPEYVEKCQKESTIKSQPNGQDEADDDSDIVHAPTAPIKLKKSNRVGEFGLYRGNPGNAVKKAATRLFRLKKHLVVKFKNLENDKKNIEQNIIILKSNVLKF